MIEDPHVNQLHRLAQATRDALISVAGLTDAARMIVLEDQRGRVGLEYRAKHFAPMYGGSVNGAAKEFLRADEPMTVVEE